VVAVDDILAAPRPSSVHAARAAWPTSPAYHPSPADWRHECLYFLLPDRFSDETPTQRPVLDRSRLRDARGGVAQWPAQAWSAWADSGQTRFQGGTLKGAITRLGYLKDLGITALWIGPVWKQRRESFRNARQQLGDEYHGYGIQDFLDVDPRFGSRRDLVDLVAAAHALQIRVIFDVIVNHTGRNWLYERHGVPVPLTEDPDYDGHRFEFGAWLDRDGRPIPAGQAFTADDAVWPIELQDPEAYHRYGERKDWNQGPLLFDMFGRDLALEDGAVLDTMITCWSYWIALTDCDGFRIDTLKHFDPDQGRRFCNAITEFAETLGKDNFMLVGEVASDAGHGDLADTYLAMLGASLDAVLAIDQSRQQLREAARGQTAAGPFLDRFHAHSTDSNPGGAASHRVLGSCQVTLVDDHDGLNDPRRFPRTAIAPPPMAAADDTASYFWPIEAVPAVAFLLLTLGIPCLYYGLEQGMAGPAIPDPFQLPSWLSGESGGDRYLREAMFGPEHPRPLGPAGQPPVPGGRTEDGAVPGFGPFGTSGAHLFDRDGAVYQRVQRLCVARATTLALRVGRQYARPATAPGDDPWDGAPVDGLAAWSRIVADQEAVVVVNVRPSAIAPGGPDDDAARRSAQILVDGSLNPDGTLFEVVASTAERDKLATHLDPGSLLPVHHTARGAAYLRVTDLPGQEVVVLTRVAGP